MHIQLPIPSTWRSQEVGGRRILFPDDSDGLCLVLDPLVALPPLYDAAWLTALVHRDVPPGTRLAVRRSKPVSTRLGWPSTVLDIQLVAPDADASPPAALGSPVEGGLRLVEQRITTFYRFLEYGALAEIRARDMGLLMRLRDPLRALLAEARPSWEGSDTSLARLLAGVTR